MTNDILKLDIHKNHIYKDITAKQYDKNSRTITVHFYDNDVERRLEPNEVVRLRFTKPDKTWGIIDIDENSKVNNTVIFTMIPEMLDVAGKVKADVGIYIEGTTGDPNDDKLISTFLFYINVEQAAYDEEAVMTSEKTSTLINLIARQRILNKHTVILNQRSEELITQMEQMLTILNEIVPILEDKYKDKNEEDGEK